MGNHLTKGESDYNINNTLLGKRIQKILKNKLTDTGISNKKDPKDPKKKIPIWVKENLVRACCLGIINDGTKEDNFIIEKFPKICDKNKICSIPLGLQYYGEASNLCPKKYLGADSQCDAFMINNCAKSLNAEQCLTKKKIL